VNKSAISMPMCAQSNGLHFIFRPKIQRRDIEQELDDGNFKCSIINQFTLLSFLLWDFIYLKLSSNINKIDYLAKGLQWIKSLLWLKWSCSLLCQALTQCCISSQWMLGFKPCGNSLRFKSLKTLFSILLHNWHNNEKCTNFVWHTN
jgi:hypothetical protein